MRDVLGPFEFQILQTLLRHPRDAYGVTIRERLKTETGREPSIGALYTTLDRLEQKGFVKSWWGEATAERGGRRKRYFAIQAPGEAALQRTQAAFTGFGGTPIPQGA